LRVALCGEMGMHLLDELIANCHEFVQVRMGTANHREVLLLQLVFGEEGVAVAQAQKDVQVDGQQLDEG
jgi:hypothetical protein